MANGVRRLSLITVTVAALTCQPALAQSERPITDRTPDAMDVAKTPITDLNLTRTEVPALLVEAEKRPYSLVNMETCAQLTAAVVELNGILGPDMDLPQAESSRFDKGRIAQAVVARLIPFRSLIREVSGANRQERELREAIQAGLTRRGFLKGVGAARNCPYPASPATESIVIQHEKAAKAQEVAGGRRESGAKAADAASVSTAPATPPAKAKPVFTSQPVVQPTR